MKMKAEQPGQRSRFHPQNDPGDLIRYASDYCDVFLADRILEQIDPSFSFAADLIEAAES